MYLLHWNQRAKLHNPSQNVLDCLCLIELAADKRRIKEQSLRIKHFSNSVVVLPTISIRICITIDMMCVAGNHGNSQVVLMWQTFGAMDESLRDGIEAGSDGLQTATLILMAVAYTLLMSVKTVYVLERAHVNLHELSLVDIVAVLLGYNYS